MFNRKLMFVSLLFVFIVSLGMVCASEDGGILSNGTDVSVVGDASDVDPVPTEFKDITIGENYSVSAYLKTIDGNAVADMGVSYSYGSVNGSAMTGSDGKFDMQAAKNSTLVLNFAGDDYYLPANSSIYIGDFKPQLIDTKSNVTAGQVLKTYAVDFGAGERGTLFKFRLTDVNGNPVEGGVISFAYKTTYFNRTTDENGLVSIGISTQIAGDYLCALAYTGDDTYNATYVPFSITVMKKTITITAAAKTFKKSDKTKKYTVTLKTKKFSSKDGNVYLKAGKKVTLKVGGKTYTAKTNAAGKATFKINKLTKKGKFSAVIKFAGDVTYKAATKTVKITIK